MNSRFWWLLNRPRDEPTEHMLYCHELVWFIVQGVPDHVGWIYFHVKDIFMCRTHDTLRDEQIFNCRVTRRTQKLQQRFSNTPCSIRIPHCYCSEVLDFGANNIYASVITRIQLQNTCFVQHWPAWRCGDKMTLQLKSSWRRVECRKANRWSKDLTRIIGARVREQWRFCQFQVVHRRVSEEAEEYHPLDIMFEQHATKKIDTAYHHNLSESRPEQEQNQTSRQ